jgi:hypothetical protein
MQFFISFIPPGLLKASKSLDLLRSSLKNVPNRQIVVKTKSPDLNRGLSMMFNNNNSSYKPQLRFACHHH